MVKYLGDGLQTFHCPNGIPFGGYNFAYKKGSSANSPFVYGVMSTVDGRADANTEWHGSPNQPNIYFGCQFSTDCDDTDYGIEIQSASGSWALCCNNVESRGPSNPPWRQTFHNWWAFKTCQTSGSC